MIALILFQLRKQIAAEFKRNPTYVVDNLTCPRSRYLHSCWPLTWCQEISRNSHQNLIKILWQEISPSQVSTWRYSITMLMWWGLWQGFDSILRLDAEICIMVPFVICAQSYKDTLACLWFSSILSFCLYPFLLLRRFSSRPLLQLTCQKLRLEAPLAQLFWEFSDQRCASFSFVHVTGESILF